MDVQVIGTDICDSRHIGGLPHGNELEAGKLHNSRIVLLYLLDDGEQRTADVSALVNGNALGCQQLGNDGGSGGLSVGACHCVDGAGTKVKEYLHFGSDGSAVKPCLSKCFIIIVHSGGAENNVIFSLSHAVKVAFSERKGSACGF